MARYSSADTARSPVKAWYWASIWAWTGAASAGWPAAMRSASRIICVVRSRCPASTSCVVIAATLRAIS
ncbi:hypothetical protein JOC24_002772 [Streptomyces sp. HB132]|nr:hypothetical protein [Streptomyces sp. HB132]